MDVQNDCTILFDCLNGTTLEQGSSQFYFLSTCYYFCPILITNRWTRIVEQLNYAAVFAIVVETRCSRKRVIGCSTHQDGVLRAISDLGACEVARVWLVSTLLSSLPATNKRIKSFNSHRDNTSLPPSTHNLMGCYGFSESRTAL